MKILFALNVTVLLSLLSVLSLALAEGVPSTPSLKNDDSAREAAFQKAFAAHTPGLMRKVKPGEGKRMQEYLEYSRTLREILQSHVKWEDKEKVFKAKVLAQIERNGEI